MKYEKAFEIVDMLEELYAPKFKVTKRKLDVWIPALERMDYEKVKANVTEHALRYPYSPVISDIAAYEEEEDDFMEKVEQWKREAAAVPPEVKREFFQKFEELLRRWER
ncbi:hypothetical protein QRD89_16140 [Halobacillus sp. ACCC02827]|uniref:hypothetical protein n=1 Tax=Bacillaceae TaxID=186817 RepID=UPI0002A51C7E|nr:MULTISPECIES: hypothetical protein [Bacillaceae]ELK46301.1 hypothetical protein D479_11176 [Halobacillus sp. BAB-2008]QHT47990.1 hypothetical protein M662_16370 [Bacillus sp. SB49]WJE15233.1 hypothetical protein QRD89_16140 [Halobacillus sp. ACCC02827]